MEGRKRILQCSIWQSTANSGAATSSVSKSMTCSSAAGPRSSSGHPEKDRPAGPVRDHGGGPRRHRRVAGRRNAGNTDICSRAASGSSRTSRHGRTPACPSMGGARRARWFGVRHAFAAPNEPAQIYKKTGNLRACNCCSAIQSWRAPFAISGSRWMTPSASRSQSSSNRSWFCGLADPGPQVPEPGRRNAPFRVVAGGELKSGSEGWGAHIRVRYPPRPSNHCTMFPIHNRYGSFPLKAHSAAYAER